MSSENTYTVRIFKNASLRLFHVAINFSDAKTANLKCRANKMSGANRSGNNSSKQNGDFTDGFHYMLANTTLSDWSEEILLENVDGESAKTLKDQLVDKFRAENWDTNYQTTLIPGRHRDASEIPPKWVDRITINPTNTDLKKFKSFCKKCVIGLDIPDQSFVSICNKYYRMLIDKNGSPVTRYDVWKAYHDLKVGAA